MENIRIEKVKNIVKKEILLESDPASFYLQEGISFLQNKLYQEALESFEKCRPFNPHPRYPNKVASLINRVEREIKKNDLAKQKQAKTFTKSDDILPYLKEGMDFIHKRMFKEALESLEKCESLFPKVYMNKAIALANLGKQKEAFENFDKAIDLKPDSTEIYFNKGITFEQFKMFREALECFDKTISIKPENDKGYFQKGVCLKALEKYQEAIENFDKALSFNKLLPMAHFMKGEIYLDNKLFKEAVHCFENARSPLFLEASNKNKGTPLSLVKENQSISPADAYYFKGFTLACLGMHKEAIQSFGQALESKPDYKWVNFQKGKSCLSIKMWEEAITSFEKELALYPDYSGILKNERITLKLPETEGELGLAAEAHCLLGLILEFIGRHKKAVVSFDQAIAFKPDYAQAYVRKGKNMRAQKKHEEALRCFEQALDIKPIPGAYYLKGDYYLTQEMYEEAIQNYDQAIQKSNHIGAYSNKGLALEKLGKLEDALQNYEEALSANPNSLSFYFKKAIIFYNLERDEEAIQTLEKMMKLNPNFTAFEESSNFNAERNFEIDLETLRKEMNSLFGKRLPSETHKGLKILAEIYREPSIGDLSIADDSEYNRFFYPVVASESSIKPDSMPVIHSQNNLNWDPPAEIETYVFNPEPQIGEQNNYYHNSFLNMQNRLDLPEDVQEFASMEENRALNSTHGDDKTKTDNGSSQA